MQSSGFEVRLRSPGAGQSRQHNAAVTPSLIGSFGVKVEGAIPVTAAGLAAGTALDLAGFAVHVGGFVALKSLCFSPQPQWTKSCLQFLLASLIGGTVVVGAAVSSACAAIGAVAAAIAGGAAVGYVAQELQPRPISEVQDQRLGESIPPIRDDWRQVVRYEPPIFQNSPGEDPIGPKGPGPNIRWKLVAGTITGIVIAVKSQVLQPQSRPR